MWSVAGRLIVVLLVVLLVVYDLSYLGIRSNYL